MEIRVAERAYRFCGLLFKHLLCSGPPAVKRELRAPSQVAKHGCNSNIEALSLAPKPMPARDTHTHGWR